MHGISFLQDLAIVMIVAGLVTLLFHRLKQPVVLGYLLAGIIIGPHTPPFPLIQDEDTIKILADLGVVFLLFSIGLEFSIRRLLRIGWAALIAALCEIMLMILLGYQAGYFFGWAPADRLMLGIILAVTSTTIIMKSLRDARQMQEPYARLMLGICLVEDVFVILVMICLPTLAVTGTIPAGQVMLTMLKLFVFLVAAVVSGLLLVPRLLRYVARHTNDEMLLITVLGVCFAVSLLTLRLGLSLALGAFLAGAIMAESREVGRIERIIAPVRDLFSAIFFVAMGMLLDPGLMVRHALPVVSISLIFIGGKIAANSFGVFMSGYDSSTAFRVGTGMAQLGEFSFILAGLGFALGFNSDFLYPIAVAVTTLNALIRPYLVENADAMARAAARLVPPALAHQLQLYNRWVAGVGRRRLSSPAAQLVRSLMWQITLNAALVAGVFISAAVLYKLIGYRPEFLPHHLGGDRALWWLAAAIVTLPVCIVTARKMQVLAMLLAEIGVPLSAAGAGASVIRSLITNVILAAQLAGLLLLTLLVSSALLPPWRTLLFLLIIIGLLLVAFGKVFNRWYTRAKVAFLDTWSQPTPPPPPEPPPPPLPALLKNARMDTVTIQPQSPGAGHLIRELEIRLRTGVSIVAIERSGKTIVNPGPDEEIQAGDQLLLLGDQGQLEKAESMLKGETR